MRSVSLRHQWVTGWNSTRCSRATGSQQLVDDAGPRRRCPGASRARRCRCRRGRTSRPRSVVGASYTLATTNSASSPARRGELAGRQRCAGSLSRRRTTAGAEAGPAERVHAEVALEVDEVDARSRPRGRPTTSPPPRSRRTKWRATCQKPVDAVEVGPTWSATRSSHQVRFELEPGVVHAAVAAPGRATTASSTGGTFGGRCWRGLGGREQPSLLRHPTVRRGRRRNDDLADAATICASSGDARGRRSISPAGPRELAEQIVDRDPLLLHRVAVADSDGAVVEATRSRR